MHNRSRPMPLDLLCFSIITTNLKSSRMRRDLSDDDESSYHLFALRGRCRYYAWTQQSHLNLDRGQRWVASWASLPRWSGHRDGAHDVPRCLRTWERCSGESRAHPASQVGRHWLSALAVVEDC